MPKKKDFYQKTVLDIAEGKAMNAAREAGASLEKAEYLELLGRIIDSLKIEMEGVQDELDGEAPDEVPR